MACDDDNWHDLWDALNKQKEPTIFVSRAALADVVECHHDKMPPDLVVTQPRANAKKVEVSRPVLFNFLQYHGAHCASGPQPK